VILFHGKRDLLPITAIMAKRCVSTQEITKNIRLMTEDKRKIEKDPKTLRSDIIALTFDFQINQNLHLMALIFNSD
jgi:hypothetical protein